MQFGSFPKLGVPFLGVPIIGIIIFWGLYWGPFILGNYHLGGTAFRVNWGGFLRRLDAKSQIAASAATNPKS